MRYKAIKHIKSEMKGQRFADLTSFIHFQNLASYARPLFLRLLDQSEHYLTGTYKLKKTELVKEGFLDVPAEHLESIYYYDMKTKQYLQMDEQIKQKIVDGEIKF